MLVLTEPTRKGRCGSRSGAKTALQGRHFDRVAQGRAGAVGFHVIEVVRRELGVGQRAAEDRLLGAGVGGGQAVAAAVLVDGRAAQQAEDPVAGGLRIGEPLEQHHATALSPHEPVRRRRKRLTPTRRRQHPRLIQR